jgi:capsular polysaccharide biosynthesis protein
VSPPKTPTATGAAIPLTFVDEAESFELVSTLDALTEPTPAGRRLVREAYRDFVYEAVTSWWQGRVGGPCAASWDYGLHVREGPTELCQIGPAWWFPRYGVLIDARGRVPRAPAGEAIHAWPRLEPLPGIGVEGEASTFTPPKDVIALPATSIALPWGMSNYGHFVYDALASILALEETGLLERFPLAVPPLTAWQRGLIRLVFPDVSMREVREPVVQLEAAVFSTAMDHVLHMPGPLVMRLRERVRACARANDHGRRIYISRRSQHMRVMVDEPLLEAALAARGFEIIRPERLSVAEQIALFREASVIVGASGAGLANVLFADAGARVIEIQPQNFTSFWVAATCRLVGLEWSGFFCASPSASSEAPLLSRLRRGFRFAYRLDVAAFMAFLDSRL